MKSNQVSGSRLSPALPLDKAPHRISGMFDAIASRYDLLNSVLSGGLDRRWRDRAVGELQLSGDEVAVDLCTGTADLALTMTRLPGVRRVIGVDFSAEMLRLGQRKVNEAQVARAVTMVRGDAMSVPVTNAIADVVTIGFGIRNVQVPSETLGEVHRILRPGGRVAILEFGFPRNIFIRNIYKWYFRRVLPLVGKVVSRHSSAYSYLPASVGTFCAPAEFCSILSSVGFTGVRAAPLTFGIVYLYLATKSAAPD